MKKAQKNIVPDLTEYTDEGGKRWIQTSADDLFSIQELNDILESIDKEVDSDEIVLARIDFQKVNKEYYDEVMQLQTKLKKMTELLKKVITDSRQKIERKNAKLKELIDYIRKLHVFIAHINTSPEELEKLKISPELIMQTMSDQARLAGPEYVAEYEDVEEVVLPLKDK